MLGIKSLRFAVACRRNGLADRYGQAISLTDPFREGDQDSTLFRMALE